MIENVLLQLLNPACKLILLYTSECVCTNRSDNVARAWTNYFTKKMYCRWDRFNKKQLCYFNRRLLCILFTLLTII